MIRRRNTDNLKGNHCGIILNSAYSVADCKSYLPVSVSLYAGLFKSIDLTGECSAENIRWILSSPSLTYAIINAVHSPVFSKDIKIESINDALLVIGNDYCPALIGAVLNDTLNGGAGDEVDNFIRVHTRCSLKKACLSSILSREVGYDAPFTAYLAGLLCDVGMLALIKKFPLCYSRLHGNSRSGDLPAAAEEKNEFGITHSDIGSCMVGGWSSFPFLADALSFHHHPLDEIKKADKLVKLTHIAGNSENGNNRQDDYYLEAGKYLFDMKESQLLEFLSIAELKARATIEELTGPGNDMDSLISDQDVYPSDGLLEDIHKNYLISSLKSRVQEMEKEEDKHKSILRSLNILGGVDNILLFTADSDKNSLECFSALSGGSESILSIPLTLEESLITMSFRTGMVFNSFDRVKSGTPVLIDSQAAGYLGKDGFFCFPVNNKEHCTGVAVLGINESELDTVLEKKSSILRFLESIAPLTDSNKRTEQRALNPEPPEKLSNRKIVHEINNPLGAIKNYLTVLDLKLSDLKIETDEIRIINNEIDRIGKLLKGINNSPDRSTGGVKKEPADINRIIGDIITLSKNSLTNGSKIEFLFQPDNSVSDVIIDKDAIMQVLLNLVKNSIEAMPEGGKITIKAGYSTDGISEYEGRKLEIDVIDNGPGIPGNIRSRLFQGVPTTKSGHSGLGLSIVGDLVRMMKGVIRLEDQADTGTKFKIVLPVEN